MPRPQSNAGAEPMHQLVDSTGLKLCGAGEWLVEKHGTRTRRSRRKQHIGMDVDNGQIAAVALTVNHVDVSSQVSALLQVVGPVASFTGDGDDDREDVSTTFIERYPEATVIVPPRSTAMPSETAVTEPTQRDRHLQFITEHGRMGVAAQGSARVSAWNGSGGWQKASGYTTRARVEATIGRFKQVIDDGLRSRTDQRRATEVDIAVHALNRMLEFGRPISVRIA